MTDSYTYLLVKSILTLVFVLGLLGVALFVLRRYMNGSAARPKQGSAAQVRVITSSFLGPKRNIAVVEVAGEMLVVGLTPTAITYLTKIERQDAIDELRRMKDAKGVSFLNIFKGGF